MEGVFQEFENENSLRLYPFAAGCVPQSDDSDAIHSGVFVDAAIYPVNPSGPIYLSSISEDGIFSISDSNGVIMTGSPEGSIIDLFDLSELHRHSGTIQAGSADVLEEFALSGRRREYTVDNTSFASSCVFPVMIDGVSSLSVGETGYISGDVAFSNGPYDDIRVSSASMEDGRSTLRFDVLPKPRAKVARSIRRIICVVDGNTPFRIRKILDENNPENGYNTVILELAGADKDTICSSVHRENQLEMADTCSCDKPDPPSDYEMPYAYNLEEVFIPPDEEPGSPEGGLPGGANNSFYLVTPNRLVPHDGKYWNPISITLEDGSVSPDMKGPDVVSRGLTAELKDGGFLDEITSRGIVIQVPGLSGGSQ